MAGRGWFSFKIGGPFRLIVSRTGIRPAVRGKHFQVSPRSAFFRFGPFKWFAGRR